MIRLHCRNRVSVITMLVLGLIFLITPLASADTVSQDTKVDLATIQKESKVISQKALELVKQGKIEEAENLPESKEFQEKLKNDPAVAAQYFSSLEAFKAQKEGKISLGENDSQIMEFNDGSFIVFSTKTIYQDTSKTTSESGKLSPNSVLRDPPGSLYYATDDFQSDYWGAYKAAEFHLYTYYEYGMGYVKIDDVWTDAQAWFPAFIDSQSASIMYNRNTSAKSRGNFAAHDPAGSFGRVLYTTLTNGAYYVTVNHSTN